MGVGEDATEDYMISRRSDNSRKVNKQLIRFISLEIVHAGVRAKKRRPITDCSTDGHTRRRTSAEGISFGKGSNVYLANLCCAIDIIRYVNTFESS